MFATSEHFGLLYMEGLNEKFLALATMGVIF
jgi:hypothetical protein